MIKVTDLSKVFRTEEIETTALNKVSFEIKDGEFVAIMGPSGCGKSTLLNILGLLDNPTDGSYQLLGQEVGKISEGLPSFVIFPPLTTMILSAISKIPL